MPKRLAVIIAVFVIALTACSTQPAEPESNIPEPTLTPEFVTPEQSDKQTRPSPEQPEVFSTDTETSESKPEHHSGIRVSTAHEERCTIIAEIDNDRIANPVYVYLYADQPVHDILISGVYDSTDINLSEREGLLYIPELSVGQTVKLIDPYPYQSDSDNYYTRIAYTNSVGDYEAMLLHGEKEEENPSLVATELGITGATYDRNYIGYEQFIASETPTKEFKEKTIAGDFDDYVPQGLCIAGGTVGDVDGDGTQDALMYLVTSGRRAESYTGVMPIFILLGSPNGGYSVEKKAPNALFAPYRSESYAIAGNAYIDIVHEYVGGAACHHKQVFRFGYIPDQKDWVLSEISYQPTYNNDYSEMLEPGFVQPLHSMTGLTLEEMTGSEYYNCLPDWNEFDSVCELPMPGNMIYTLGIRLNNDEGYYEGYIYAYYDLLQSGGFVQTIRGEYNPDMGIMIQPNYDDSAFIVNQDIWKMSDYDKDSFQLAA